MTSKPKTRRPVDLGQQISPWMLLAFLLVGEVACTDPPRQPPDSLDTHANDVPAGVFDAAMGAGVSDTLAEGGRGEEMLPAGEGGSEAGPSDLGPVVILPDAAVPLHMDAATMPPAPDPDGGPGKETTDLSGDGGGRDLEPESDAGGPDGQPAATTTVKFCNLLVGQGGASLEFVLELGTIHLAAASNTCAPANGQACAVVAAGHVFARLTYKGQVVAEGHVTLEADKPLLTFTTIDETGRAGLRLVPFDVGERCEDFQLMDMAAPDARPSDGGSMTPDAGS
jgi:hypothetical protein